MNIPDKPLEVIWDITYACPLRCSHCYSESGRRPARRLGRSDLLRAARAICALGPYGVSIAGGEPLSIPDVAEVVRIFSAAGISTSLNTSGWTLRAEQIEQLAGTLDRVSVSLDGATAEVHDRIRGRAGSFHRATGALERLDDTVRRRRDAGRDVFSLGIDFTAVRSNFHQVEWMCAEVAARYPALEYLAIGAAVPEGLASRAGFARRELLSDAEAALLGDRAHGVRLQALAPATVQVSVTDNLALKMHPELVRAGVFLPVLQIEPDGEVRAMPAYEGTVGNVLCDAPHDLWRRAVARWHHPFVVAALEPARTMEQWAAAVRAIDHRFGTAEDRARIARRPEFTGY
ncbi:radical SAM protein [Streptomyces sp. ODS05-4]|uniref:radical SAM protein n=1 Tax=Streptomyces sp. ODS05-4 TaxID=2944939 RepID=UPI00210B0D0A|nr:radical SAM protein [Streptomyces sp. ODS05-4]